MGVAPAVEAAELFLQSGWGRTPIDLFLISMGPGCP